MSAEIIALIGLAPVFAISAIRNVHMGALALVAAFIVGIGVVGEGLDDILERLPGGRADDPARHHLPVRHRQRDRHDRLARGPLAPPGRPAGGTAAVGMWLIGTGVACLGTSHAAFAVVPIAMSLATTHRISPTLMGIAMSSAIVGGALAPDEHRWHHGATVAKSRTSLQRGADVRPVGRRERPGGAGGLPDVRRSELIRRSRQARSTPYGSASGAGGSGESAALAARRADPSSRRSSARRPRPRRGSPRCRCS